MIQGDDQRSGGKGSVGAFYHKYPPSFSFSQGRIDLPVDHFPMPLNLLRRVTRSKKWAGRIVDVREKTRRILDGLKDRRAGEPVLIFFKPSLWKQPQLDTHHPLGLIHITIFEVELLVKPDGYGVGYIYCQPD